MGDMHASSVRFTNSEILQLSIQKRSDQLRVLSSNRNHAFLALFLLLLIQTSSSPASAQLTHDPNNRNNKSDFAIMGIVAIMFFISGFLSLYSRQCAGARVPMINLSVPNVDSDNRPSHTESNSGLNREIIDTFPTFLYSNVKGLKIGKGTLACAVCLSEFQDEETLRLIPKCNHVFHPSCIDVWLSSHSTCPLCRANLVPRPEDTVPVVSIQIPRLNADDHDHHHPNEEESVTMRDNDVESGSPKVDYLLHRNHTMNHNRPTRSRSTGFLFNVLFPRCNSTGHTHQHGENLGRFTLRLPDEVRSHVLDSALKRANSSVCFTRMSSERKGYRTRSVGSGRGRSYLQQEEEWGFTLTPPFFTRNRSVRKSHLQCSGVALLDNNIVGERSSDLLCPGQDQT